jgi:peptide deformylase
MVISGSYWKMNRRFEGFDIFRTFILGVLMSSFSNDDIHSQQLDIITIDSSQQQVLTMKTENFRADELPLAQEIAQQLYAALQPYFPAAGLAAPQIGINKSIFLYSYDRDPKHLEAVINPTFIPIDDQKVEGWEGCFSVILSEEVWMLAKLPRYEKIKVTYFNLSGEKVEKILDGFAAKVFQHEWDHLQGVVNIYREDAMIQQFATKEELFYFMQTVKKEDAQR